MDGILFLAFIIFMFVGVPILLPRFIIKITKTEEDESPTENTVDTPASGQRTQAMIEVNEKPLGAKSPIEQSKQNKEKSSAWVFLAIAGVVPGIALAIFFIGVVGFALASIMSIAAFGYGGFFDFAFSAINLSWKIFLFGFPMAFIFGIIAIIVRVFE